MLIGIHSDFEDPAEASASTTCFFFFRKIVEDTVFQSYIFVPVHGPDAALDLSKFTEAKWYNDMIGKVLMTPGYLEIRRNEVFICLEVLVESILATSFSFMAHFDSKLGKIVVVVAPLQKHPEAIQVKILINPHGEKISTTRLNEGSKPRPLNLAHFRQDLL